MCMYHEGLRSLSQWWRDNAVDGVQDRDLALSLVVLPAKERGHSFLDWFAENGSAELWQVRALRKMAYACDQGLMEQIRDLPDEQWEWGIQQVLPHLAKVAVSIHGRKAAPSTIFHKMMVAQDLRVDEILAIGVLQGVRPRTTCLQWYAEHKGESGNGWPIPLLEGLAERVFNGKLLDAIERLPESDDSGRALGLLRAALQSSVSGGAVPAPAKKRDCCGG